MEELESQLEEFAIAIRGLSRDTTRPKTAFELLDVGQYEGSWQSYLRYFLDPDQPHQLKGEFLSQFFGLLEHREMISFLPPETSLRPRQGVEVSEERQSADDNRPDLIITSGSEWFLCIELKVHSSEGGGEQPQTTRYANDEEIVPGGVSTYEDGNYIYIKPTKARSSTSSKFSDLDWRDVQSIVQDIIANSTGHVSGRSIAQLSDFSTLIESQLSMADVNDDTRKRKDLYFKYRDEINDAQDAIKEFVKTVLQQKWRQALEGEYKPRNDLKMEWQYDAIGHGYGQVRVPRWETAKSGSENLDVHWEHKPTKSDFSKGQLRFILEIEEPDRSTIGKNSGERYYRFREDVLGRIENSVQSIEDPRWKELEVNPGRSKKKLFRFVYDYQPGDEDGYYQALQFALEDTEIVTQLVAEMLETEDYTQYPRE